MKINVIAEGRKNIWIPEKQSLKKYIKAKKIKYIHNMTTGNIMLGADHDIESVLKDIDSCDRLAIFTDDSNMGHSLALIENNILELYDIGKITLKDLNIKE